MPLPAELLGTGVTPPQGPLPCQHLLSDIPTAPTQPVKPVGDLLMYWGWIWFPATMQGSEHGPAFQENLFPIRAESQPFLELRCGSCGGHGHPHCCGPPALCSGRVAEQPLCPKGECSSGCEHLSTALSTPLAQCPGMPYQAPPPGTAGPLRLGTHGSGAPRSCGETLPLPCHALKSAHSLLEMRFQFL